MIAEYQIEVAVEAAARQAFEVQRVETAERSRIPLERFSDWENVGPVAQNLWRSQMRPLVMTVIESLSP